MDSHKITVGPDGIHLHHSAHSQESSVFICADDWQRMLRALRDVPSTQRITGVVEIEQTNISIFPKLHDGLIRLCNSTEENLSHNGLLKYRVVTFTHVEWSLFHAHLQKIPHQ